jgi:hypothetical protein
MCWALCGFGTAPASMQRAALLLQQQLLHVDTPLSATEHVLRTFCAPICKNGSQHTSPQIGGLIVYAQINVTMS